MSTEVGKLCGARVRSGGTCRKPPVPGRRRCRFHGGLSPRGVEGGSYRHGRYSKYTREALGELVAEFEADDRPLDTSDEIALMRALLADFTSRYEEIREALLAWNVEEARKGRAARPARVPELLDALPLLDAISRATKRERDTRVATGVSREALARIVTAMREVVSSVCDEADADEILARWKEIRI